MKIRQLCRARVASMHYALFGAWGPIGQFLTPAVSTWAGTTPQDARILDQLAFIDIRAPPTVVQEPVVLEYQVRRRRDGELVATVDTLEAAEALVEKHYRQKKAALEVFLNGEPVLFVMQEHAQ